MDRLLEGKVQQNYVHNITSISTVPERKKEDKDKMNTMTNFKLLCIGRRSPCFLKLFYLESWYVYLCLCVHPRLLYIIHVKRSLNNQLNKSYWFSVSLYGTFY